MITIGTVIDEIKILDRILIPFGSIGVAVIVDDVNYVQETTIDGYAADDAYFLLKCSRGSDKYNIWFESGDIVNKVE